MLSRATFQHRPSSQKLLARVLSAPELPSRVRSLPSAVLGKLIDEVGLEDAGELVALASTEQLAEIFDRDLWRSERPGEDERFDSERFVLWLEVMLEAGDRALAERLADLPEDLLTLALHRHVLVVPLDDLRQDCTAGGDRAHAAEKAFESCLSEQIDDYELIWRGGNGWDAVLAAILALDREHHSRLSDILDRCAAMSREYIDDNGGLYEVLTAEQTLEDDLAGAREARRGEQGYVAPSGAAAFMRLALGRGAAHVPFDEQDAITRAYFRNLAPAASSVTSRSRSTASNLFQTGVLDGADVSEVLAPNAKEAPALLVSTMRELAAEEAATFRRRADELAYLANVLVVGCTVYGRRLRPIEAVEHVISTVSVGLRLACRAADAGSQKPEVRVAARVLRGKACDGLFRLAMAEARRQSAESASGSIDDGMARVIEFARGLRV